MLAKKIVGASLLALCLSLAGQSTQAQPAQEFQPQVGQEGKDVIWVPTPQELVDKMLDMAKVTPKDFVIDLGSGDGRTVITAAKRGAKALGIEYNPEMVELSKRSAATEGVSDKASFIKADLFESDFSQAQVITMFLLSSINMKLRKFSISSPARVSFPTPSIWASGNLTNLLQCPGVILGVLPISGSCRRKSKAHGT